MTLTNNYKRTMYACFIGYMVQAIINNFVPLLFLTFHTAYHIPLSQITLLVTFNFGLQLIIDFISPAFIDKIGYKTSVMAAHVLCTLGLLSLTFLPELLPSPFTGLLLSVTIYALGGGLLEVLISPIMEACPTDNKEKAMSLLHSFYCWGHVGVVLLSTVFFQLFGIGNWKLMAVIWALVPLGNFFLFAVSPVTSLSEFTGRQLSLKELLLQKRFWVFIVLMVAAGACEQAVSQWASAFAEKGLHISKTAGDLAGPMFFAILMGTSRFIYGKWGEKINLEQFMVASGMLCLLSYLIISLSPWPLLSLLGCGLCGLSVGILWPGTFSMATKDFRGGSTAMFAFFALAGDLGCGGGPTFVGLISSAFGDNLKSGILVAIIFPLLLLTGLFAKNKIK